MLYLFHKQFEQFEGYMEYRVIGRFNQEVGLEDLRMHLFMVQTDYTTNLYYLIGPEVNTQSEEEVCAVYAEIENELNEGVGYYPLKRGEKVDLQPNSVIPDFAGL